MLLKKKNVLETHGNESTEVHRVWKSSFAIPRMDFALEKHLPSKLFMFNELAFSNIFCPLAPALTPNLGHYNFKF